MANAKTGDLVRLLCSIALENGETYVESDPALPEFTVLDGGKWSPNFENLLIGLEPGASRTAQYRPENAFGPYRDDLVYEIPLDEIPEDFELAAGDRFAFNNEAGEELAGQITEIGDDAVTVDCNHPLAGETLTYRVTLLEILPPETVLADAGNAVRVKYAVQPVDGPIFESNGDGDWLQFEIRDSDEADNWVEIMATGMRVGETRAVTAAAAAAFGERDPAKMLAMRRDQFDADQPLAVGAAVVVEFDDGAAREVRIAALDGDLVIVDANHPLAGKDVVYTVTMLGILPVDAKYAKVGDVAVVKFRAVDEQGAVVAGADGEAPLTFRIGDGAALPSIENLVLGLQVGESRRAKVAAADAYGLRDPELIYEAPRSDFPAAAPLAVGQTIELDNDAGGNKVVATIAALTPDAVTVDGNHPLAGKNLEFQIELVGLKSSKD